MFRAEYDRHHAARPPGPGRRCQAPGAMRREGRPPARVPAGRPGPGASSRARRRPGAAQQHRPGPADRERLGYTRYWFAEHHLNPGVAGTSPGRRCRPDRRGDLERSGWARGRCRWGTAPRWRRSRSSVCSTPCTRAGSTSAWAVPAGGRRGDRPRRDGARRERRPRRIRAAPPNGLLIPPRSFAAGSLVAPFRAAQPTAAAAGAQSQDYTEQVGDILALLAGTYRSRRGAEAHACPARAPTCRSGSSAAAAARAPRSPGATACGSPLTTTSARPPCSRPSTATGPRSSPPPSWTGPTSASRPTSSWRRRRGAGP